ncbi:hypothetical protein EZJ49_14700 [Bdellovibrio bacteriovorus]|uniref:hypothetical protein n=1 Tax=Bdellovibrio bacteriovorus TaxID=959 RepID=UPI0021D2850E|nr:hypothetical protein [Bdellovibrio bacteriovorus]UXR64315.1 hypothetical protein EZJ49_14700 [Bdellovibrio bacteriovorus]
MKRVFSRITATILAVGTLSACAPQSETAEEKGTVRVLAPQSDSKSGYALQTVDLRGITDLQTVSGKFVRFFMSPRIVKGKLTGRPAVSRFIKNQEGEFIPANEMTQQLVAIYAHTQRLAQLDDELGAGGINTWPRDVGVGVRVKGGQNNNAYYDGDTDSMLVVPYNQAGLPIAINGGILAHEHFHSLFYKVVIKNTAESKATAHTLEDFVGAPIVAENLAARGRLKPSDIEGADLEEADLQKYYRQAMLRGLNEGLADYWGWMYTGNPDFIAQSLPKEKMNRSMNVDGIFATYELPSAGTVKNSIQVFYKAGDSKKFESYVTGYAYVIGTQFSRMLKSFTEVSAKERGLESLVARKEVAKVILRTLSTLKTELVESETPYYRAEKYVMSFAKELSEMKPAECEFLAGVINVSTDEANTRYSCKKNADGLSLEANTVSAQEVM